ncbi:TPA: shufflon system plasmid conjugative transfer pilus tip adhesin PilV [Salmonella enterica subsp. enterica serovar Hvittingfoss]|nr:shufflon system plasmid conjugative transfer pilus tip adhesin PilV [Salmonella enterica subsp. enterica serovar Newport]HEB6456433.1 shufflon system plasmid conjugative transfer pilus tip adhesin PilV [Salmonella enterica subsp. enterica serovar Hvittingfoss]
MVGVAAALLIVLIMATMASGYMQDYLKSRQWQLMAAQTSRFTQAVESYSGRYYAEVQAVSTTTKPVTVTAQMLKNTGFLPAGFRDTNSNGQQLKALLIRNAQHAELLQGLVITTDGQPLPYKALRQISLDISAGLGGYIRDGRTAVGAMNSWTVPLAGFGTSGGNGHIAVLLSPETLTGAREDSDRLYRFQVNGRPELNKMHTSIDMGGNNLNSAGVVNGRYGNFDVSVVSNGPVTAGGDIRSTGGWIISRHGRGWMDETHGGGFYMTDNEWILSLNNKSIYTGGQLKGGSVRSDGDLSAGGILKLDQVNVAGTRCPQKGAISYDSSGGILTCQYGLWAASGKVTDFEMVNGNNACGKYIESKAYCPAGKQLISGGYVLSKWSGGSGWNTPDLSIPSPSENAWKIYTGGGVTGGTCMQAIAWCARN